MADRTVRYSTSSDVTYTKIDEQEAVLLHLGTQRYYSLNETGIAIWELLAQPHSIDEVSAALAERYQAERAALTDSVARFVGELRADGLLREV